jgi:hypothetical protein
MGFGVEILFSDFIVDCDLHLSDTTHANDLPWRVGRYSMVQLRTL